MIILIPRRVTIYFCPRCKARQSFFSVLPVLTPEWRCRRCQQKFRINAICLASNWAGVFGLWSMPPALFLGGILCACVFALSPGQTAHPVLERLEKALLGLLCGGPTVMLVAALCSMILGYIVGLVYGAIAVVRRRTRERGGLSSDHG